jgi:hypothetical protein
MFVVVEICSNARYTLLNIRYSLCQSHRLGRHFHASLSDVLTSHEVLKLQENSCKYVALGKKFNSPSYKHG